MAKRPLHKPGANRPQVATISCLACNWRQFSNKSLRELRETHPEISADFTGHLTGFVNGSVIVGQFQNGKQIGFVSVALPDAENIISQMTSQTENAMARILAAIEEEASLAEAEEASEAGDEAYQQRMDDLAAELVEDDEDDPLDELRLLVSEEEDDDE